MATSRPGRVHAAPLLFVLLLATTSLALLRISATPGSDYQPPDSRGATQVARDYFASLNHFLAGGELPPESRAPELFGAGGVGSEASPLELLALRSTYPGLQFDIANMSVAGDMVVARTVARRWEASLPAWLHPETNALERSFIESFRIQNGRIVEQWSSARPVVLAHLLLFPGAQFWSVGPASLTISELSFASAGEDAGYALIAGPGILAPRSGERVVAGNGLLQVASWADGRPTTIPVDAEQAITPGTILVIPRGGVVVWHRSGKNASALLMSALPVERRQPDRSELDGCHRPGESLLETLQGPTGFENDLWFGSARVLAKEPVGIRAGILSMDFVLAVVPLGEAVTIDDSDASSVVLDPAGDGPARESRSGWQREITNTGESPEVLLIMRASGGDGEQSA